MRLARSLALCTVALSVSPAHAGGTLDGALAKLGSGHIGQERDAAWAACLRLGRDQDRLVAAFEQAGWERHNYEDEGTFSYSPKGQQEKLWVMLYEGDPSCSVIDQQTGTGAARALLAEMLSDASLRDEAVGPDDQGDCPLNLVTVPNMDAGQNEQITLQVISGGDYADCTSDGSSALLIGASQ